MGITKIAIRYVSTLGIIAVESTIRMKMSLIITGSVLKYSPIPPSTPVNTLFFLLLYNFFIPTMISY